MYYKSQIDTQTKVFKATIISKPNYIPDKSGIVRIEEAKGIWKFTQKENGETKVLYQFLGDPGGNIPSWIINIFIVDGPYKTLMNLKQFVKKYK